ncbi:aldehyde dehydrogenase family protein [Ensifer adhaerens]|uniref:aldehyde dehydrogenase family protein n=1 Tax=Ensifer canadensis TaxID=555315 RepID=UPI0014906BF5|nr:aldehyde dehydrogenase family protein [Ensifer canadensis]NOV17741.1 aldehyde dehydrogenase family protein [Ensifer canadensis]
MHNHQFYIDGKWVDPVALSTRDVINPSTGRPFTTIAMGSTADVDRAVIAARRAFADFGFSDRAERLALLERMLTVYRRRADDLALAISSEMGAPRPFARDSQVGSGDGHLEKLIDVLRHYSFEHQKGTSMVLKEPIGVAALITPWNWPLNQIMCKVGPAIAAGCTMILKSSELAPLSALIFAEIMHEAGTPNGVFNLINGDGPTVGAALSSHPDIDMVSFTGSTRAGIAVAKAAADTVKRVAQELGGKSANILLPDCDLETAVTKGVEGCFGNSGQSCNAPTRMFVPRYLHDEAIAIARRAAADYVVGPADEQGVVLGPVVSEVQFNKIQALIQVGIDQGATLVAGGVGRPDGREHGYFVKPTIFANVTPDMRIAREEIFGPVLSILPYATTDEAVTMANDTPYGLASYVQTQNVEEGRRFARRMRSGNVFMNYPDWDTGLPFGGYKQSGNGREYAEYGLEDFLEIKGVAGWGQ